MKKTILILFALLSAICVYAQTAEAPASGDGTEGNPYQIATWQNLYWIRQNSSEWNKHFTQTADITFPLEITGWDNSQGWNPIGDDFGSFGGSYDGNDKTISGLYINRPTKDHIGLFGRTYLAEIKDLNLLDVSINGNMFTGALVGSNFNSNIVNCNSSGDLTGSDFCGGLAATNTGGSIIENCHSNVNITSTSLGTGIGGLVGHNGDSSIKNSNCSGNITGEMMTGGFVGINSTNALIIGCYCSGNVIGENEIGGFVGDNNHSATIENCYTTSEVYGDDCLGGFAGRNSESIITNCYSRGNITCDTNYPVRSAAGFIGYMDQANISNCFSTGSVHFTEIADPNDKGFSGGFNPDADIDCEMCGNFWDVGSSGQDSSIGNALGLNTDIMRSDSVYMNADWNFNSIWGLSDTINDGYPHLYRQSPLPHIDIISVTNIAEGSARITGDLLNIGEPSAYQYGFCWNIEGDLTIKSDKNELGTAESPGTFQTTLNELIPGAYYYIRAYIISDLGMTYSNVINFRSYKLPLADNIRVVSVDSTTCAIEAEAVLTGYPLPSMHGFCWNTEGDPLVTDSKRKLGNLSSAGRFGTNIRFLTPGTDYYIRAFITNAVGTVYSDVIQFTVPEVSISDNTPSTFALSKNYPNPFNPSTTLEYQLPESSDIEVSIHDMSGRRIRTLVNAHQDPGYYRVKWDAGDVPSGIYIARMKSGEFVETQKMVLMK